MIALAPPNNESPASSPGFIVAFEGPDGSGKSTQCRMLASRLKATLLLPLFREDEVERMLDDLDAVIEVPDVGSRYAVVAKVLARQEWLVEPALNEGRIIIYDKFMLSLLGSETARGTSAQELEVMLKRVRPPDITFVMDVPPLVALERKQGVVGFREAGLTLARYRGKPVTFKEYTSGAYPQTFLEQQYIEFQQSVRASLRSLGTPTLGERQSPFGRRMIHLNATSDPDSVFKEVWRTVAAQFPMGPAV